MPADTLFHTGNILTLDPARPVAQSLAVWNGRILAIGSDAEIAPLATPATRRVDLAGQTVLPGFIDCHLHLVWLGTLMTRQADLVGVGSFNELVARLQAQAARSQGWIQGHGFDQSKLPGGVFPTRAQLDAAFPDRPVLISRICGHAAVANSAALAHLMPADRELGDEATGLYTENAISALYAAIPPPDDAELDEAAAAAVHKALSAGITSVHTLLDVPAQLGALSRLRSRGQLPLRVTAIPQYSQIADLARHGLRTGFGDDTLRLGGAKFFADGSLGAHTAWMREPYADAPHTRGLRLYDEADLAAKCADAAAKGFQICIHAIGDAALQYSIDAIEFALAGERNTLRHRIEHASVCPPDQLERLARLDIPVTLQPQFVTSDTWTGERLGPDRAPWAYPFASLIATGVTVGLSSDAPVEQLDGFACLHSACNRHAWSLRQTLTIAQALHAYTVGSASCVPGPRTTGSLTPGMHADFITLTRNPLTAPAQHLAAIKPAGVYVAGNRVAGNG